MSKTPPEIVDQVAPRAADRILTTARQLFYRDGIRAVGVDEIVTHAGVTKPSLYRGFGSKDELVVAVLKQTEADFWARFELSVEAHPDDARAQLLDFFKGLAGRSTKADHRGCGLSNALVEYPEPEHGGHQVALSHKRDLRVRLRAMAAQMGARDADGLGDALLLLIEGAYLSSQIFGAGGPSGVVAKAAEALMAASVE
jgi:AcrR family transcriptional regulator